MEMVVMSQTAIKNRINQLIKDDDNSDKYNDKYYQLALLEIKNHLNSFFAHYAKENKLTTDDVASRVDKWSMNEWKKAIDQLDLKDYPKEAKLRVKALSIVATINNHKMLVALIGLSLVKLNLNLSRSIGERIDIDVNSQKKFLKNDLKLKKATSVITQQKTKDIWSDNLWQKTDELANDIEKLVNKHLRHGVSLYDLDRSLVQHSNPKQFKPNQYIGDRIKQLDFNTRRIVRTESSRLINQVNVSTYRSAGIKEVDVVNQPGACLKCQGLAEGGPYSLNDAPSIPENFHPNCRCILYVHNGPNRHLVTHNNLY